MKRILEGAVRFARAALSRVSPATKKKVAEYGGGLLLAVLVTILTLGFETTMPGEEFERATYNVLQRLLTPGDDVPVTVVDISQLRTDRYGITPRKQLRLLLEHLLKRKPKDIGVDIDFSPLDGRFITPCDPAFFDFCLNQAKPIFLGISRSQALPPDEWLGVPEFKKLAAALLVPSENTRRLTRFIGDPRAPTMSSALAGGNEAQASYPSWLPLETISKKDIGGVTVGESPIDYSIVTRLKDRAIEIEPDAFGDEGKLDTLLRSSDDKINGKMILIGDLRSSGPDVFSGPAMSSISGVLLHASGAYTAVKNPLYDIREPWRKLADLFLTFGLMTVILIVRLMLPDIDEKRLFRALSVTAVVLVLLLGIWVDHFRIMWEGFLLVAIVLAVHPFLDEPWEKLTHALGGWLRNAERKHV